MSIPILDVKCTLVDIVYVVYRYVGSTQIETLCWVTVGRYVTCADPEIFMRGGPTKMVIFGHRRGGVQPSKNPEITFF